MEIVELSTNQWLLCPLAIRAFALDGNLVKSICCVCACVCARARTHARTHTHIHATDRFNKIAIQSIYIYIQLPCVVGILLHVLYCYVDMWALGALFPGDFV